MAPETAESVLSSLVSYIGGAKAKVFHMHRDLELLAAARVLLWPFRAPSCRASWDS